MRVFDSRVGMDDYCCAGAGYVANLGVASIGVEETSEDPLTDQTFTSSASVVSHICDAPCG